MHLTRILIIITAIFVNTCIARIAIEAPKPADRSLIEAAVQISKRCYGHRVTPVGLSGNAVGLISRAMWSQASPSLIALTNAATRVVNNGPVLAQSRHKLQLFVVTASSSIALKRALTQVKASIWWNHMASFLILDWPQSYDGCSNAFEILWAAWEMNILYAKFMCYHRTRGRLIYTFNPYTSQAPAPWHLENRYRGKNDHPWVMFVRVYEDNGGICSELDFEKANDVGGSVIWVSATDQTFGKSRKKPNNICVGTHDDIVCQVLFFALNATPKVRVHNSLNSLGYLDANGTVNGILAEVMNGSSDFGSTTRYLTSLQTLSATYPNWQVEIRCLTQYRGHKSQLSKIASVIDRSSLLGLYTVCIITVLFFKYFVRKSTAIAYLSTLRLICNSPLPRQPYKFHLRLYLGSLFLFAITMQGIYQGRLASLLTKQEPLRNVNSKRDLAELNYTIYGSETYRVFLLDSELRVRYVGMPKITCTDIVVHSTKAACVADTNVLIHNASEFRLHLSRERLVLTYASLPIRPDWPLEERVNRIIVRARETFLLEILYDKTTYAAFRQYRHHENEHSDRIAKVLNVSQLGFAFAILGFGLACAAVSLVVEINLQRARTQMFRILSYLHHVQY